MSGTTLHVMTRQVDAGPVVDQRPIPLDSEASVLGFMLKAAHENNDMLLRAYRSGFAVDAAWLQDDARRTYRGHPRRDVLRRMHRRGKHSLLWSDVRQVIRQCAEIA